MQIALFSISAVAFAKQFNKEKATVIRISGLDYHMYDIDNTTENETDATKEWYNKVGCVCFQPQPYST